MGHFFNYDNLKHKHTIYAFPLKSADGDTIGYHPYVSRHEHLEYGFSPEEHIGAQFPELECMVLGTEKEARQYAASFFAKLPYKLSNDELHYLFCE